MSAPPETFGDRITLPGRGAPTLPPVSASPLRPASLSTAVAIGARFAIRRLSRRGPALAFGLAFALTVAGAVIERKVAGAGAVDRALAGCFGLMVPLLSFALLLATTGRARLADAAWSAARYGVPRREVALGLVAVTAGAAATASALLALTSVAVAHTAASPPLAPDLFTSGWIGLLTGAAYAGWFALGASFGRRGGGRLVPLLLDFTLGGAGIVAAVLPHGNAQNLLGGAAPLGLAQPASAAVLIAASIFTALGAAFRCKE